jgi:hypothetical protein
MFWYLVLISIGTIVYELKSKLSNIDPMVHTSFSIRFSLIGLPPGGNEMESVIERLRSRGRRFAKACFESCSSS